jgi:hypothetical protein
MAGVKGVETAWAVDARLFLQPASWVGFTVTRAALFGSTTPGTSVKARDLLNLVIGQNAHDSENYADNQVVAVDGWFRMPASVLPLKFYWDWGADDSAGAWSQVAGRVFGLELAALPGAPAVGVGLERVLFEPARHDIEHSRTGPWYLHSEMVRGWSTDGTALGHPWGGSGSATVAFARMDAGRLRAAATAFRGVRGRDNQFAPAHHGRVTGFTTDIRLAPGRRLDLGVIARAEWGSGWHSHDVSAFLSRSF